MATPRMLALVFSRDRALQLDGMLRSFFMHAMDSEVAEIVVLYASSPGRHQSQYEELAGENAGRVFFLRQTDFRSQVLELLREASTTSVRRPLGVTLGLHGQRSSTPSRHVLFLVDDALFVHPFRLAAAGRALDSAPDAIGFSFRLGRNTRNSYVLGREQSLPTFESPAPSILRFRWTTADGDFGYPLELSSSLYRSADMEHLFRRLRFSDPNTLESQMSLKAPRFGEDQPSVLCWESSAAFSAPVNRVQEVYQNRVGSRERYSLESLADAFERGQRLDLAALNGFVPSACHQEIEPSFEERQLQHGQR